MFWGWRIESAMTKNNDTERVIKGIPKVESLWLIGAFLAGMK